MFTLGGANPLKSGWDRGSYCSRSDWLNRWGRASAPWSKCSPVAGSLTKWQSHSYHRPLWLSALKSRHWQGIAGIAPAKYGFYSPDSIYQPVTQHDLDDFGSGAAITHWATGRNLNKLTCLSYIKSSCKPNKTNIQAETISWSAFPGEVYTAAANQDQQVLTAKFGYFVNFETLVIVTILSYLLHFIILSSGILFIFRLTYKQFFKLTN